MSDVLRETVNIVGGWLWPLISYLPSAKEVETVLVKEIETMLPVRGQVFVRLAGLSGALAVILGAYGAHVMRPKETDPDLKHTFETASRYHFLHTLALLGVPLTRRPYLVGTLILSGMTIFSGSCYYHALTGSTMIRRVTPYGGTLLIIGWAAMIL